MSQARAPERAEAAADTAFLEGGGELGALMRAYDWTQTPLGAPARWPRSLKTAVRIMLTSRQPFWIGWGPELTYLYNDPYKSIIGGKHPRALGRPFKEVWREIWDVVGPMADTVMSRDQGTYVEAQLLIMERHGYQEETYYTFSYSPVPNDEGGPGGLICANTDDTRRVIGERELATLRELAARTANARSIEAACASSVAAMAINPRDLPFSLVYLTSDGEKSPRLAAASPGTEALGEANLWPWNEALSSAELRLVALEPSRAPPAGAWPRPPAYAAVLPITASGPTGRPGILVVGLNPFRLFDDNFRGFVELVASQVGAGIANAEAYEQERKRAEALAELDQAKTAFFSNVSHEFRTPLTLMLGPLEDTLAHAQGLTGADRERLEVARRNSLRLLKLVNTLLDFSRIEAGRIEVSYQPTDLGTFTAELASVFRSAIEGGGLSFDVDCPPLGKSYVDRELWEKIVFNLLSNAFKFTFEGSIAVAVRRQGDSVTLSVRDTGTGIPAADREHVFERFHRVKGARRRTFEGSGIGLSLVRELVKLHGGTVSVESEIGRGSCFTVSIPASAAERLGEKGGTMRTLASTSMRGRAYVEEILGWSSGEPTPRRAERAGKSVARVLLADDNADMRDYVRRMLAEHYEVEAVGDGLAALASAREKKPDLVLTDVMMPRLDGFGLMRELRADERLKGVPVIMLSARAGEEARVEGIEAGADDYLVKPFSARELLARVSARLDQVTAREALKQSERRYRHIFETAAVSIWEEDFSEVKALLDGLERSGVRDLRSYLAEHPEFVREAIGKVKILDVNEATLRMFGATDKNQLMQSLHDVFVPESEHVFAEELLAIAEKRPLMSAEIAVRTLAGQPLELLFNIAFPVGDPLLRNVLVSLVDITPRKRAERAVQEEANTLETLNRVGMTIAAELDLERLVQAVTDAATEVSGAEFGAFFYNVTNEAGQAYLLYTLSGVPREAFEKFGMPRNTPIFAPTFAGTGTVRLADVTTDPRYGQMAPHHGMPKGHLPVKSYLAVPVISRSGAVIGGLFFGHSRPGVFDERAERLVGGIASQAAVAIDGARLYEQRLQLIEQLRESDRRKDEFLATLAHELRNPLAPLKNSLHLMRVSGDVDASSAALREMMERQVNHLIRLVDDLLEVSRISRGAFELRRELVEVSVVVRNAVETSEPSVRAAGHELLVSLPKEQLWLDGDPVRLAQILANLLNNAAKYTGDGGRIELHARREGANVAIAVRDNGMGIAAEALPRLFEMFSRGEHTNRRDQGGLGIGLALARGLAEMHGGTIIATSAGPGQGSEFTVTLPLVEDAAALPATEKSEAAPLGRLRILVVDDNRDAAESLGMLLEVLGAEATVACDGFDALELVKSYDPAVVLLDIGMPEMDGYEVARRIRADFPERRVVLVALTGWGQEDDRRRAKEAGFDHHLIKPANIDALQKLLTPLAVET